MRRLYTELIRQMKNNGVEFEAGLKASEIADIESSIGAELPPDLRQFYEIAFPVRHSEGVFPEWRKDPKGVAEDRQGFIEDLFKFDIEYNSYWHENLGPRPDNLVEAQKHAIAYIRTLPPLIGIYSHRFITSFPHNVGNPVVSFHGPSDTIYYGTDLYDYLQEEFTLPHSNERRATKQWPTLEKWGGLFFEE